MNDRRMGRCGLNQSEISPGAWLTFGDQVDEDLAEWVVLQPHVFQHASAGEARRNHGRGDTGPWPGAGADEIEIAIAWVAIGGPEVGELGQSMAQPVGGAVHQVVALLPRERRVTHLKLDVRLDLGVTVRRQTAFDWAAGVFSGFVDWSQTVNLNAGYQVNNNLRVHAIATNVLDQKRFHIYGGSVIGRRVIAGVTAAF